MLAALGAMLSVIGGLSLVATNPLLTQAGLAEPVEGGLQDIEVLRMALRGCDWCFHLAASYHLWLRDYRPMYQVNVQGTRSVIEAAGARVK